MDTKFRFFNFPICKLHLGTWARRVHRACRAREHVGHVGIMGASFSRLPNKVSQNIHQKDSQKMEILSH